MEDLGCTVHPDGTLKEASETEFFLDKDDDTPMLVPSLYEPHNTTMAASSSSHGITSFFMKKAAPAVIVGGAHHSLHTTHPSAHVLDLDNAEAQNLDSTGQQHKAVSAAPILLSLTQDHYIR